MASTDIGLKYVQQLGIRILRSPSVIISKLATKMGFRKAKQYFDKLAEWNNTDRSGFYEFKNQDYDAAMIFSGTFDADIVRKSCNWIDSHREAFGKTILEIGCDCGFMTAFLSQQFPDAQIVALERGHNAIGIAKRNVERFGSGNVEFIEGDLGCLRSRQFDTVFSMRTVQENRKDVYIKHFYDDFSKASDEFQAAVSEYLLHIKSLMAPAGTLVSIERMDVDPLMLGWLKAINSNGLSTDPEEIDMLPVQEGMSYKSFPAIIARSQAPTSKEALEAKWLSFLCINEDDQQWTDYKAIVVANLLADKMVKGSHVMNKKGEIVGKFAYYTLKANPAMLLYQALAGEEHAFASLYPKEMEDVVKGNLASQLSLNRSAGFTTIKIS